MTRLIVILGVCYATSLIALLALGVVPGIPWEMIVSLAVHSVPMAATLAWALTSIDDRLSDRWRWAVVPGGIGFGLGLVWFFNWTIGPFVIVPAVLIAAWQFVIGKAKTFVKPLGASLLILLLGYGTVWNINYLAGHLLPMEALRDQELLDFDVALYRDWLGWQGGGVGLFPVVRSGWLLRFLEHAYMVYYDEVFLVILVLLYRRADLTRFFSIMFGCFLIGIPIFLLYPSIGPFTYQPETVLEGPWRGSSTFKLMSNVVRDWQALRAGAELQGYGYFIAMPSMHVAVATVLQVFSWQCKPVFWMLLPINVLLMLATFLLGWHYILDVPAGLAVAGVTLAGERLLRKWWSERETASHDSSVRAGAEAPG